MADLWYRTKEWNSYINNLGASLADNEEFNELMLNLRIAAADYHKASIGYTKRDVSESVLISCKEEFEKSKNLVEHFLEQNSTE